MTAVSSAEVLHVSNVAGCAPHELRERDDVGTGLGIQNAFNSLRRRWMRKDDELLA